MRLSNGSISQVFGITFQVEPPLFDPTTENVLIHLNFNVLLNTIVLKTNFYSYPLIYQLVSKGSRLFHRIGTR